MATSHIPVVSREGDRGAPGRGVNGDACPTLPGAPGLPRGLCPAWTGARGLAPAHAGAPTPEPDPVPHGAQSASCMPARTSGGGLETPDLLWLPNWHLGDPGPQPVRGPLAHSQLHHLLQASGLGRTGEPGGSVPGWGQWERRPHPPSVRNVSCPSVASGRTWGPLGDRKGPGPDLRPCPSSIFHCWTEPSTEATPGSGVARLSCTPAKPPCRRGGAGRSAPPPPSRSRPLKNNEVQVAPREA